MVKIIYTGNALWERIERAVEKVKDRLHRVTQALDSCGVPYAVVGGNAVQIWVAQVDESAVRNTRDVDIVLNRSDLPTAIKALESAGFIFRQAAGVTMFLDGPQAKSGLLRLAHDAELNEERQQFSERLALAILEFTDRGQLEANCTLTPRHVVEVMVQHHAGPPPPARTRPGSPRA